MRTWLACAGGSPIVALTGKLAPLFGIFLFIMLAVTLIIEGLFELSFRGDAMMMVTAGALLIIAYLGVGTLMQLLAHDLATGLGITGLIVSPAFGYIGVGFPILGMNAFAYAWSAILPLRWYMAVLFGQAARGLSVHDSAAPFAALAALAALYALFALLRLRAIGGTTSRLAPAAEAISVVPAPGVVGAFAAEWQRVLAIRGAFALLVLAPLIYGVYYPQPYLNQILRKLPIAVVDNDLSELSRRIVETLDASGAVQVAVRARTLAEARTAIDRGEAFAAVGIPPGAQRDVLKGTNVHLPVYVDATYLFIFRSIGSGIATAIGVLSSELASGGARTDNSLVQAKLAAANPADILLQPVFNPVGGYASYIVPAAFVLILQQTLLIGAAMLTGLALARPVGGALQSVLGRGIAHLTIYLPALALYFIMLPRFYGFSTLGSPTQLFVLALAVHPGDELPRPGGRCLVQASGDADAYLPRHQPAAVLHDRIRLAARSDPRAGARRRTDFPRRFRDRRYGPHRSARRTIVGRGARLGRALVPCHCLFLTRGDVGGSRAAEADTWLAARHGRIIIALAFLVAGATTYLLLRPGRRRPWSVSCERPRSALRPRSVGSSPPSRCRKVPSVRAGDVVAELSALELDGVGRAGARGAGGGDRGARSRLCRRPRGGDRQSRGGDRQGQGATGIRGAAAEPHIHSWRAATMPRSRRSTRPRTTRRARRPMSRRPKPIMLRQRRGRPRNNSPSRMHEVEAATSALAVLERRLDKTTLRAPADGVVTVIVAEVGEAIRAGQPVLAIEESGKQWLSFNVREDFLYGLTVGTKVDVVRQGAQEATPAVVTELLSLGAFATWQAERAVGDHDRNTLRLRIDPVGDRTNVRDPA